MRTLIAIMIGVVVLLAVLVGAAEINRRRQNEMLDGPRIFIWVWLVACIVDFWVGAFTGHRVSVELGLHLLIFIVPAALAWFLSLGRRPRGS
jgi:hypothetical protein